MSLFSVMYFINSVIKEWKYEVCSSWDTLRPATVHWACSERLATYKQTSCIQQHYVLSCKSRHIYIYIYIYVKEIYSNLNGLFKVLCIVALIYCIGFILAMSNNILYENILVFVWVSGANTTQIRTFIMAFNYNTPTHTLLVCFLNGDKL